MIVYKLTHRRYIEYKLHTGEPVTDNRVIGFFKSREDAESAADRLREKPGFADHPRDFFIDENELSGEADRVYLVEHSYYIEDDRIDNIVVIGAYSDRSAAMTAAEEYEADAKFPVGSHVWDEDFDIDNYLAVSEYTIGAVDFEEGFSVD